MKEHQFYSMKHLLILLLSLLTFHQSLAQETHVINVEQLNRSFTSYLIPEERAVIDSILNQSEFTISLVSLKPVCEAPDQCYEESIILEDLDLSFSDSIFWVGHVERFRMDLFDSIVPLEVKDYGDVMRVILMGIKPWEGEGDQIINMCYNPRHAIVIIDSAENVCGVYEICFECGKTKVAFSRIETVEGISSSIYGIFKKYGFSTKNDQDD